MFMFTQFIVKPGQTLDIAVPQTFSLWYKQSINAKLAVVGFTSSTQPTNHAKNVIPPDASLPCQTTPVG